MIPKLLPLLGLLLGKKRIETLFVWRNPRNRIMDELVKARKAHFQWPKTIGPGHKKGHQKIIVGSWLTSKSHGNVILLMDKLLGTG